MKKKNITKVKAPKGFRFKILKPSDTVFVQLFDKATNQKIGNVNLVKLSDTTYATHSWLDPRYHQKGFGTLMYARAIQWCHENGYVARSSGNSSEMAQRMWNGRSIRKFYSIKKKVRDSGSATWYAYNKNR
jgi:GNAT superfamily N-acetyltransferase